MAPENRQRQRRRKVTLACEPCRYRKSRCDGGKPICSTCQRRSLGLEQCIYKTSNARTACGEECVSRPQVLLPCSFFSSSYTKSLHEGIRQLEQACSLQQREANASASGTPSQGRGQFTGETTFPQDVSPSIEVRSEADRLSKTPLPATHDKIDAAESMSGVTAMGTMLSEDLLDGSFRESQHFFGGSCTVSFLKEACHPMGSQSTAQSQVRQ